MKKTILLCGVLMFFAAGCSTAYKPGQNVMAMTAAMSEEEARQVLHRLMLPRDEAGKPVTKTSAAYAGICKAYPFQLDELEGPELRVTRGEVSLNAVRKGKLLKTETRGTVTSATGMSMTHYFERVPYREHLRFDKLKSIKVHEPGTLGASCGREEGQTEAFISEAFTRWYIVLIPTAEKERFIAAWLRLKPDLKLTQ